MTNIDRDRIAWLYEHTDTKVEVIALTCGCCESVVKKIARTRGLPRRQSGPRRVDADSIARLYAQGMGPAAIASKVGCCRDTVQRIVRAKGIVRRRRLEQAA